MIQFNFDGAKVTRHGYRAKQVAHFGQIEGEIADYYRKELDKLAGCKDENNHVVYEVDMRTGTMYFQWSDFVLYIGTAIYGEARRVWVAESGEKGEGRGIIGVGFNRESGLEYLTQRMDISEGYQQVPGQDRWENGSPDYYVLTPWNVV